MPGKTAVALKHLRQHLGSLLAVQFRGVPFTETQVLWKELAEMVLAKIKVDSESPSVGLVAH
jgi:ATP-dependent RNA helicase DHX29